MLSLSVLDMVLCVEKGIRKKERRVTARITNNKETHHMHIRTIHLSFIWPLRSHHQTQKNLM